MARNPGDVMTIEEAIKELEPTFEQARYQSREAFDTIKAYVTEQEAYLQQHTHYCKQGHAHRSLSDVDKCDQAYVQLAAARADAKYHYSERVQAENEYNHLVKLLRAVRDVIDADQQVQP